MFNSREIPKLSYLFVNWFLLLISKYWKQTTTWNILKSIVKVTSGGIHKQRWKDFEDFWPILPRMTGLLHKLMLYRWHWANPPLPHACQCNLWMPLCIYWWWWKGRAPSKFCHQVSTCWTLIGYGRHWVCLQLVSTLPTLVPSEPVSKLTPKFL